MTCKRIVSLFSITLLGGLAFFGLPLDDTVELNISSPWSLQGGATSTVRVCLPDWLTQDEVLASPYRRSVRRTARRTSRRTSRRHGYGDGGYYYGNPPYHGSVAVPVGAAVAVPVLAAGTIVVNLPPACGTVVVDGYVYYKCAGTYYAPSGSRYIVVNPPY